jgi:CspA family cold shock protein
VPTGRVKFYETEKGFGYLARDGDGADVYVRKAALAAGVEGLSPGKRVEFDVIARPRGLDAPFRATVAQPVHRAAAGDPSGYRR